MKKSNRIHLQRRFLTLLNTTDGHQMSIRCVEESVGNYWGYPDRAPLKVHRFPKSQWEAISDKTK